MSEPESRPSFYRSHPVFFWGMVTVALLFLAGSAVVASRVPTYRREAAQINGQMTAAERVTRDKVLQSRARRSDLAVALLEREMRVKQLQQKGLHLALDTQDSMLYLRSGSATLRQVHVSVGPDSTVRATDGRTWRMVRALGERTIEEKQVSPVYTVPEWVYVSRGEPVPPEAERRIEGGLGAYVLRLDDGTEIYSQPEAGPHKDAVKPGAFVVRGNDLAAIFGAVKKDLPVFIY